MKIFNTNTKRLIVTNIVILSITILLLFLNFNNFYQKHYVNFQKNLITNNLETIYVNSKTDHDKLIEFLREYEINVSFFENNQQKVFTSDFQTTLYNIKENAYNKFINDLTSSNSSINYYVTNNAFDLQLTNDLDVENYNYFIVSTIIDENLILVESKMNPASSMTKLNNNIIFTILIPLLLLFIISNLILIYYNKKSLNKLSKSLKEIEVNSSKQLEIENNEYKEIVKKINDLVKEYQKTEFYQKELIANVSHDLKTPLTSITGYSELMIEIEQELTVENVKIIHDEAIRLKNFVNDLLDLSKLQSSFLSIDKSAFNLNDLVNEVTNNIKRFNNDFTVYFIQDNENIVNADRKKIEQVLYNLINNAINYTNDKKELRIVITTLEKEVLIEIIDFGTGIEKDELKLIFERYYKSQKNHKTSTNGSGIGLSIVKEILTLHNVKFGVKSSNKGSNFYFYLEKISNK